MDTDALVRALAANVEPAPKKPFFAKIALALTAGLLLGLVLLTVTLGFRPDLGTALWAVAAKALLAGVIGTVALSTVVRLSSGMAQKRTGVMLLVLFAASLAVAAIALASEMPEHRWAAWTGGGFPWCLVLIPLFSIPTSAGLVWAMRDGAPTKLTMTGAVIGALSGSVGTIVYAGFCPIDSVAFVTTWYVLAIAISAGLGALAGRWLLRW
jgi:hypothetical protein